MTAVACSLESLPSDRDAAHSGDKPATDITKAVSPGTTPLQQDANVQPYDMGGGHREFEISAFQDTCQSKALNQRLRSGAEAVIVVNNQDDEVFVVVNVGLDEDQDGDTPLTVLVTKHDVDKMIAAMQVTTIARVHLIPQKGEITTNGVYTGPIDWPMVRTSSGLIFPVLSKSGWGACTQSSGWPINKMDERGSSFFTTHNVNQD
jgi:hypothetical protein